MIKENTERNTIIYGLWENGETIDEIAFGTGIPRSTVGYYVRKFNKKARRGEPIILPHNVEELNSETLVQQAFFKKNVFEKLAEMMGAGEIDSVYKYLMIMKLTKELHKELTPTKEESEAFFKLVNQGARNHQKQYRKP